MPPAGGTFCERVVFETGKENVWYGKDVGCGAEKENDMETL